MAIAFLMMNASKTGATLIRPDDVPAALEKHLHRWFDSMPTGRPVARVIVNELFPAHERSSSRHTTGIDTTGTGIE